MAEQTVHQPLRFYDYSRQSYSDAIPPSNAGEIMIGDYRDDGCVSTDGEFRIVLHDLGQGRRSGLSPQVRVFGDGTGALCRAIDAGLLNVLGNVADAAELSRRLIGLGMVDGSHKPLPDPADDIHEVDHSWTNDGTGHCRVCGAPSAELEAAEPAPTTISDAEAAGATAVCSATLRGFLYAALHNDVIVDAVNDLLFDHVVGGHHHPSVVVGSLRPLIDEVLDTATVADWQHVADDLVEEARQATATDVPPGNEEGA